MRDLLAIIRNSQSWQPHVSYAASLATKLHGSLTGLYLSPQTIPISPVASPALASEILEIHRAETERARRAEAPFRQWATERTVPRCAWRVVEAPLSQALEAGANWYDAVVVELDRNISREDAGDIGEILVRVDLPFLVVPEQFDSARLDTIAVAWNGSPESVRALHSSLPLLRQAGRIVLICGQRHEPAIAPHWHPAVDIDGYLHWQGLAVERVNIEADAEHVGATIMAQAERVSADLLVLGAYGRTRFSEWFFGGVTRHALQHTRLPLFMRH